MKNKLQALQAKLGEFKGAIVAGSIALCSVGAYASSTSSPLDTALTSVTTTATSGLSSIESHSATVIAAVFGVVLLFVGAKHLFSATKSR